MSNNLGMAAQLAGQSLRFGWYFALNRLVEWRTSQLGLTRPRYKPTPARAVDAGAAGRPGATAHERCAGRARGLYPPMRRRGGLADQPSLSRAADAGRPPRAATRRANNDATTAKAEAAAADVPEYYAQDFHFQTGGYLSRRIGTALRHPGGDAVHGRCRAYAPRGAAPHRRVHARTRPAAASRCSTSPAAPGASCGKCGSPTRPCGCRASTCRAPISTRRAGTSSPCAAPS